MLGDSYAAMLNHFFDYQGKELGFKARIITSSSCMTIPAFDYQRIAEWGINLVYTQIKEAEKYFPEAEIIFLTGMWSYHCTNEPFKDAFNLFLASNGFKTIVLGKVPLLECHHLRSLRFKLLGFE